MYKMRKRQFWLLDLIDDRKNLFAGADDRIARVAQLFLRAESGDVVLQHQLHRRAEFQSAHGRSRIEGRLYDRGSDGAGFLHQGKTLRY